MGVKHQKGKQRKDKFYQLAKDTGYRARSAFKLIQLNRRFEFLQSARVVVDLCAAPGSWMQVARQNMPLSSVCVGIDRVPIKAVPRCVALCEDITTSKCRQALKRELKTWKADVVLHDGAPNVGKNWLHDAFKQNELTLAACSLAADVLRKGGWFVTKVFRSKDYHALIWVFKILFAKVHATKPQASRNESAEIFVVCQGYKAPDKIDPKLLNPKYVFGELDTGETPPTILGKVSKKVKPVGYAEGDASVYSAVSVHDFITSQDHLALIQKCSKVVIDSDAVSKHPSTTDEIRTCCEDVKVLGKPELKKMLKWRKTLKEDLFKEEKSEEPVEKDEEEDELAKVDKEIEALKAETKSEAKKKCKKLMRERQRILEKLRRAGYSSDARVERSEQDLFSLRNVTKSSRLLDSNVDDIPMEDVEVTDDEMDAPVKSFERDDKARDALGGFDESVEEPNDVEEFELLDDEGDVLADGLGLNENGLDLGDSCDNIDEDEPDLIVDETQLAKGKKTSSLEQRSYKANAWFGKDVFDSIEDETEDFGLAESQSSTKKGNTSQKSKKVSKKKGLPTTDEFETKPASTQTKGQSSKTTTDLADNGAMEECEKETEAIQQKKRKRVIKLDAEGFTLGSMITQSKKARRDIIESAYNRYTTNDVNLPKWFVDDERKHMRKRPELDPALLAQYNERLRDVNVRPVKKVAEAKARKKRRIHKRMEKARKRAEVVMDKEDTSTIEKARELKKIYQRAQGNKKKPEVKYVVAKKSTSTGRRAARPAGVKGQYKVVDPRMKKDLRAQRRVDKRSAKGSRQKTKGRK